MEREWSALVTEEYVLIKHCNVARSDVMGMMAEERSKYLELLKEERENEERATKGLSRTNSKQDLPSRG